MVDNKILPGNLCDGHFPSPTEIACIWVKKIYDACSQRECDEFEFRLCPDLFPPAISLGEAEVVQCVLVPGSETFVPQPIEPIEGGPLGVVRVNVCATVAITLRRIGTTDTTVIEREICFQKEVILYAPDPERMQVLVESVFEVLACTGVAVPPPPGPPTFVVTVIVGAFIIVKTAIMVQLLVPAFGFCPVPPECEELGDLCEQFLQRPFPPFFPPQLDDFNG